MSKQNSTDEKLGQLPPVAAEFVRLIVRKMRYRKPIRTEVVTELAAHFEDALRDCKTDEQKEQKARQLIDDFGDVKLLAILLRRAKKRCRAPWRTAAARAAQALAVLFVCFVLYLTWFLTGKPQITTDYVAVFNRMAKPRIETRDNAWPHYQKAISLFIEPDEKLSQIDNFRSLRQPAETDELDESRKAATKEWMLQNEPAWREFTLAGSKPYCFREYKVGEHNKEKWTWGILLPNLSKLRSLANLGIWRSRFELAQGKTQQAFETSLTVARMGRHWQEKTILVEQLVGIAVSYAAHEQMLRVISAAPMPADKLARCQQRLSAIYAEKYPLINIEGEKLFFLDTIQHVFTEGGPGGGHLIPRRFMKLKAISEGEEQPDESVLPYVALGLVHARRDETIKRANEIYERLIQLSKMSPYQRHSSNIQDEDDTIESLSEYRHALLRYFIPALSRASAHSYHSRAMHQATLTVLALHRRQQEKGDYPDSLSVLHTEGYLDELPMDPYTDTPLIYKTTADDFVLYSVGPDFEDNGGKIGRDEKGRIETWPGEADVLFWPVIN